jgi:hypothetical protein
MKSILTILTAVVLFSFSFTFSSCKSCNKKKTEPTGRGDNTNNAAKELTQNLVKEAAGYAFAAQEANHMAVKNACVGVIATKEKLQ